MGNLVPLANNRAQLYRVTEDKSLLPFCEFSDFLDFRFGVLKNPDMAGGISDQVEFSKVLPTQADWLTCEGEDVFLSAVLPLR